MTAPRMHTVDAIAKHLGVSRMTVYRAIHAGELRAHRIGHGFRIEAADLNRYLRNAATDGSGEQ